MITSPGNAKIKEAVRLRQRAKARREADAFITEGVRMFLEAPLSRIREVYLSDTFSRSLKGREGAVREKLDMLRYETVSDEVFQKISDTCSPQGILCVLQAYHYELEELLKGEAPLLLILEDIQDPGNLGTMLRTGEGAGIDGVILSGTVDPYNPKTIRGTMGSVYRVPFYIAEDLPDTIRRLRERGICVYAAHLQGGRLYDDCDYTRGSAFLIGNEGNGLRRETAKLADLYIKIPMAGAVESLNAGTAAAILTYEAARQRRNAG